MYALWLTVVRREEDVYGLFETEATSEAEASSVGYCACSFS